MTIFEILKAPTPRLEALNEHNITYIMYIEMENVICSLTNLSLMTNTATLNASNNTNNCGKLKYI